MCIARPDSAPRSTPERATERAPFFSRRPPHFRAAPVHRLPLPRHSRLHETPCFALSAVRSLLSSSQAAPPPSQPSPKARDFQLVARRAECIWVPRPRAGHAHAHRCQVTRPTVFTWLGDGQIPISAASSSAPARARHRVHPAMASLPAATPSRGVDTWCRSSPATSRDFRTARVTCPVPTHRGPDHPQYKPVRACLRTVPMGDGSRRAFTSKFRDATSGMSLRVKPCTSRKTWSQTRAASLWCSSTSALCTQPSESRRPLLGAALKLTTAVLHRHENNCAQRA